MRKIIRMQESDNVAVVLDDMNPGEILRGEKYEVTVKEEIPCGHKIALSDIEEGENVYKYGEIIGRATKRIEKGQWVHVHNVESIRGLGR